MKTVYSCFILLDVITDSTNEKQLHVYLFHNIFNVGRK